MPLLNMIVPAPTALVYDNELMREIVIVGGLMQESPLRNDVFDVLKQVGIPVGSTSGTLVSAQPQFCRP